MDSRWATWGQRLMYGVACVALGKSRGVGLVHVAAAKREGITGVVIGCCEGVTNGGASIGSAGKRKERWGARAFCGGGKEAVRHGADEY